MCPCPQQTNKNKTIIGCYQIEKQTKIKAPSDEGAVVFRRKMTEGEKAINSKFSLSLPQFRYAQQLPRQREPVFHQIRENDYNKPRQVTLPVGVIYILLFGFLQFFECCPLSRIVYRYTFLEKHIVIFRKPRLAELCVRKAFLACGNVHF